MKIARLPSHLKKKKPFLLCLCGGCNSEQMPVTNSVNHNLKSTTQQEDDSINTCFKTRSILSRLISAIKLSWECSGGSRSSRSVISFRCKEKRKSGRTTKKSESTKQSLLLSSCATDGDPSKNQSPMLSLENSNSPPETAAIAGRYMEVPFNVGLGFGLMYLIATFRNEFDKMMELRTQMEVLVQDLKNDISSIRKDEVTSKLSRMNANRSVSLLNHSSNNQNNSSLHALFEIEGSTDYDKNLKCDTSEIEELVEGVDQMEAELKVELEGLELNLDTEELDVSRHLQQQKTEKLVESLELMENHQDACNYEEREQGGVSPKELERRLHELLEARQQERITELEYALDCATKQLQQKEMEASWWKDTARLITQHVSESKCLSR